MFNLVILTGRLTRDPELKTTTNGVTVTSFTIAVDRRYNATHGDRETDFINIVAWRGTAEFVTKYFKKGEMIGIEGSIQVRNYTDKEGNNRRAVEVVANNVQFVESKRSGNTDAQTDDATASFSNASDADFDAVDGGMEDFPF